MVDALNSLKEIYENKTPNSYIVHFRHGAWPKRLSTGERP